MPHAVCARAVAALLLLLHSVTGLGNETSTVSAPPGTATAPPGTATAPPAAAASPVATPGAALAASAAFAPLLHARRKGRDRSTSSSSGDPKADGKSGSDDQKESLDLDTLSALSDSKGGKGKKYVPVSSSERRGWRKWHRKCTPCPEQSLKWRDPRILWICGGYQRARRSFKSACMMRYRNCQDGTMFVKLYDHQCKPDVPGEPRPHGDHFFYTYKVKISGDDTNEDDKSSSDEPSVSSDSSDARRRRRAMDWRPQPAARVASASANATLNMV